MQVKAMIALIEQDGWQLRGFTGGHRQYVHAVKPGTVTIPGRPSADLHPKTAASILPQAGLGIVSDGEPLPEPTGPGVYVEIRPRAA